MIIVAYDNLDPELGDYFSACAKQIKESIPNKYILSNIFNKALNIANIDLELSKINQKKFIFLAYSHGTEKTLVANQKAFIECKTNTKNLKNGFLHTNACSSGQELGKEIIEKGGLAFIGYDEEINVLRSEYQDLFMRCDNYAIIFFINNEKSTIKAAFQASKNFYNNKIDELLSHQPLVAAELINARDALVAYGNLDLTIKDIIT